MGIEWRPCDVTHPLWAAFARGLKALATEADGWSSAKVFLAESTGKTAPSYLLNLDGTTGKPSEAQLALWKLTDLNRNKTLSAEELARARGYFLTIVNAGRINPDYRRENGCKTALDLPKNLTPLVLNDLYNRAAQLQAEYCARVKETTHENEDPTLATVEARLKAFGGDKGAYEVAGNGPMQEYPSEWMKSETHYRPWWNLDGQIVSSVGFGIAKGSDGFWYIIAVIGE